MNPYIYVISVNCLLFFFSIVFYLFPPKKINALYGYRTNKSMKNDEIWHFANSFFTKTLMKYALISLVAALILEFITSTQTTWQPMAIMVLSLAVSIIKTEQVLSQSFDDDGNSVKSKK